MKEGIEINTSKCADLVVFKEAPRPFTFTVTYRTRKYIKLRDLFTREFCVNPHSIKFDYTNTPTLAQITGKSKILAGRCQEYPLVFRTSSTRVLRHVRQLRFPDSRLPPAYLRPCLACQDSDLVSG